MRGDVHPAERADLPFDVLNEQLVPVRLATASTRSRRLEFRLLLGIHAMERQ